MNNFDDNLTNAKRITIQEYLLKNGIAPMKEQGKLNKYSSPWASDSNPSFVEYKNSNTFYDFSTGKGGDIINLAMELEGLDFKGALKALTEGAGGTFSPKEIDSTPQIKKAFKLSASVTDKRLERQAIRDYALSRKIYLGYEYGLFHTFVPSGWARNPSIGFVHVDEDGKVCGVKLRSITGSGEDRFRAAGRQCFYILENILKDSMSDPILFIVESESSANSLWEHAKDDNFSCVVISFGSVSTIPKDTPIEYAHMERRIIIDYDGSEELYQERLKKYDKFKGEVIKLRLKKGQDINSMYIDGSIKLLRLW